MVRLSVPAVGVGKGRLRVGEGGFEEGAIAVCIGCIGKGLLNLDVLSADGLEKGKTGAFALTPGDG